MFLNDNIVSNKTNATTILSSSPTNIASNLIDMDAMLDQLEREESDYEEEKFKNKSIESDKNLNKIEGNNFDEKTVKEEDSEKVFCNATIEKKEVDTCQVILKILPQVSITSINKIIKNCSKDENENYEDIFDQIDKMDKLIKLEEEENNKLKLTKNVKEVEENIETACVGEEENANRNNNIVKSSFDKFITNLVDDMFDQAFTELTTTINQIVDEKVKNVEEDFGIRSDIYLQEINEEKLINKIKEENNLSSPPPPLATYHYLTKTKENEFKLTESELTLGKKKPFWIPDIDCNNCMLCSQRFSLVNRRHHCRACGRVLCRSCCSHRRSLDYMKEENPSNKQRVCTPCNRTLDRIEEYEKRLLAENDQNIIICGGEPSTSSFAQQSLLSNQNDDQIIKKLEEQQNVGENNKNNNCKKSLLKPSRRDSFDYFNKTNNKNIDENVKNSQNNDEEENKDKEEIKRREFSSNKDEEEEEQKYLEKEEMIEELNNNNNFKKSVKFRDGVHPGQGKENYFSSNPLRKVIDIQRQQKQKINKSFEEKENNNKYSWLINNNKKQENEEEQNNNLTLIESSSSSSSSLPLQNNNSNNHHHHSSGNKLPKKISRRTKERKMLEEQTSLLQINNWRVCVISEDGENNLIFQKMDKIISNLLFFEEKDDNTTNNSFINIALRRNFHVKIEFWKNFKINQKEIQVLSFTTYGMTSIGVDELMILLEFKNDQFSVKEQLELSFFNILEQFEQIFVDCLNSFDDLLDHRMGIRKCNNRIQRLYYLNKNMRILMGHTTEAIYFYRPKGLEKQLIKLNCPSVPFLLGILVREEEITWARCTPLRLLLRLGQFSCQYPTPIINIIRDQPLFTKDIVQFSVLKVLNDFRNWTYQMTKIFNSTIIIKNNLTEIFLPKSSRDEIRSLIESNKNMIAWSLNELSFLEQEMEIDSHLICEQKISEDVQQQQYFVTKIFKKEDLDLSNSLKATCASFVIFDGALKSGGDKFVVNVVEDGLIIRLQSELMEELIKILLNICDEDNATFEVFNNNKKEEEQKLIVKYISEDIEQKELLNNSSNYYFGGSLISPIDGKQLGGQFQYGLQLQRQLSSMNFFQYSTEWAIRLATVINIMPGKWPSALQPRFFDVCEQLAKLVANTLEPFLPGLIAFKQFFIAMRINVDEENVSYETNRWNYLPDQHFVWTVTLDDQIIPFLYSLCSWIPNNLRVELHMPILSIKSLPLTTIINNLSENE